MRPATSPTSGPHVELRDQPLALVERVERPQVDIDVDEALALLEGRQAGEHHRRDADDGSDGRAEPERRRRKEGLTARLLLADRGAGDLLAGGGSCGRGRWRLPLARDVVDPGDAEQDHDHDADGDDPPAHQQADERERDSDGNADRPEAKGLGVTVLGLIQRLRGLRVACSPIQSCRISAVNVVAVVARPYSRQRLSTSALTSADISISSGHGRASSSGSLCVASMPSLPP